VCAFTRPGVRSEDEEERHRPELVRAPRRTARVEQVQPVVRDGANRRVALLERLAVQELFKDLRLEDLDQLELAAALDFEALQLGERAVVVEHGVALLQQLV